jgi:hypothetical protein
VKHAGSGFFSEVLRAQTRSTSNSGQHPRSDFLAIVKCEHKICPSWTGQDPMRSSRLSLDLPANLQQRTQD